VCLLPGGHPSQESRLQESQGTLAPPKRAGRTSSLGGANQAGNIGSNSGLLALQFIKPTISA